VNEHNHPAVQRFGFVRRWTELQRAYDTSDDNGTPLGLVVGTVSGWTAEEKA
jgi:hypothetical protein